MCTPLYHIYYKYKGEIKIIQVKDESKNESTNSIKDRPAKYIIKKAYENNEITKDSILCEVTSGNMGIAIAKACQEYGNKAIILMPKFMSKERKEILKNLNAELILTDSFDEAFKKAEELSINKNVYLTKQFENENNALSYIDLCKELEKQTSTFPAVILGVGTGGSLNGIGTYLKNKYKTKVYAIEPLQTKILSTGYSHGPHRIEGLSDGFVPKLYPEYLVDNIYSIDDNDAICMAQKIKKELDIPVGISSGANFLGAVLSSINEIITVFPDNDTKYYSTDLSNHNLTSKLVDEIELLYVKKVTTLF